ncbi:MAG: TMEM43 family protein [Rhodanobacter sp.]
MRPAIDASMRARLCSVMGALLLLAGTGWVAMTERGLLHHREVASRHGGQMLDLGAEAFPQAGQQGYQARLVGVPRVVRAAHDAQFNLSRLTPVLQRRVEMFQWREMKFGGRASYELDWSDKPVDAARFEHPGGHANPGSFPLTSQSFEASRVQLGGFVLDPVLQRALPGSVRVAPDMNTLPANLVASFGLYQDYLVTSANPGEPRHGDLRVSWEEIPLQEVTVVARIDGDHLRPAADASDGRGYAVEVGDRMLLDVFPDVPIPPSMVILQRLLAILLAAFGAYLLFLGNESARREVLRPLGLGTLVVSATASVLWLGHDVVSMLCWLLLALLGGLLLIWRQRHLGSHRAG